MKMSVIDNQFLDQIELLQLSVKDNVLGRFGGNHKTKSYGSSVEFADYREYIPGDDISKIDWSIFARTDNLFLKLFLDERQLHTRIYIDASVSMGYHGKSERALELAAAIAYLSVNYMDKVSIYCVKNNHVYEVIDNIVGKDSYLNNISHLNDIEFNGKTEFIEITKTPVGYGDGNTILISDFLTDQPYENVIDHLRSKKRDVLCLQVLSKEELNPSFRGKVVLYDSEEKKKFYKNHVDSSVLKAYQKAVEYVTSRIRNYCAVRGANYALIPTNKSLQEIFFEDLSSMEIVR